MTSLLSEKNEDKSNSIYDANTDSDGESPTNDDSIYLGLIIFGSVVFALGLLCIATRICCSSFLSICLNDSVSANTLIVRVSSWTSEKVGLRKSAESGSDTGLKTIRRKDSYDHDNYECFNNNEKNKQYVKKMFESKNELPIDGSKLNWFEKINGATTVITVRDYDNYYNRKYHNFDTRKESQDTLFSAGSEDSRISYVHLTPYGDPKIEYTENKDTPRMIERPSIDSLSVPNLLEHYPQESEIGANKAKDNHGYSSNSTIRDDRNDIRTKTMNINELSFNTYRNQEENTLNVPGDSPTDERDEKLYPEGPEVKQNRSSFLRMKRRSLVSPTTYDKLHAVNNIINGNPPKKSNSNTVRSRKSPTGVQRRKTLH